VIGFPGGLVIIATGVDIVEVKRILRLMNDYTVHFTNRVFTETEIAECTKKRASEQHFAGRFATKEAVLKLLGTGLSSGVRWRDIATTVDDSGSPSVALRGRAKEIAQKMGIEKILISISHSDNYAVAFAIGEGPNMEAQREESDSSTIR
jgi:holo-[acyl-carrier protein] synthase